MGIFGASSAVNIQQATAGVSGSASSAGGFMAAAGAVSAFQSFLSGQAAGAANVAYINAQTEAYKQMAAYTRESFGRYAQMANAFSFETAGLNDQSMSARRMQDRQAIQERGAWRVAQAESGAALSGSKADLLGQVDKDSFLSSKNLEVNISRAYVQHAMQYQEQLFSSGQGNRQIINQYQNQINNYNNQLVNPWATGFSGGLAGMQTGINISSGISSIERSQTRQ